MKNNFSFFWIMTSYLWQCSRLTRLNQLLLWNSMEKCRFWRQVSDDGAHLQFNLINYFRSRKLMRRLGAFLQRFFVRASMPLIQMYQRYSINSHSTWRKYETWICNLLEKFFRPTFYASWLIKILAGFDFTQLNLSNRYMHRKPTHHSLIDLFAHQTSLYNSIALSTCALRSMMAERFVSSSSYCRTKYEIDLPFSIFLFGTILVCFHPIGY